MEENHFESLYKLLFQSVDVVICLCKMIFDTDGYPHDYFFLDVNQGFLKVTGLKREHFVGKTIRALSKDVDYESINIFGRVIKNGTPASFEKYYPGLGIHYQVIGINLGNGKFAAVYIDISEQEKAKRKLEELVTIRTEELNQASKNLQDVQDRISEGLYILDRDWHVTYINREAEKLLAIKSTELIGKDIREVYPEAQFAFENFINTLSEQKPAQFETFSKSTKKWFDISVYPYEEGLAVHFRDITEKKYSAILYSFAFNNGPNAMSIANFRDGTYIDVNNQFEIVTGLKRDEIIGKSAQELNLWVNEDQKNILVTKLMVEGTCKHEEVQIRTKNGDIRSISTHSELVYFGDRYIIISDFIDITEQNFMEMEMDKIERLNLIGQMAAGIGHEIRNPMTTVRGFLQILDQQEYDQEKKSYFKLMIEEMDRANSILKEYLSLAKNKIVEFESGDLNDLVGSLHPLIAADALNAGMNIVVEKNNIPYINSNDQELRQLVLNLVRNGFEAMPPGGNLTVRTFTENGQVVLAVQDQGAGITPEIIDKIGTPFITTKDSGTGLGLAVCYSIAQRHNARITFDTGPRGTTFYVRFNIKETEIIKNAI